MEKNADPTVDLSLRLRKGPAHLCVAYAVTTLAQCGARRGTAQAQPRILNPRPLVLRRPQIGGEVSHMPNAHPKQPWDGKVRQAAEQAEDEVRRVISYINDEVVPEVRRNGSAALKRAALALQRLAERIDQDHRPGPGPR